MVEILDSKRGKEVIYRDNGEVNGLAEYNAYIDTCAIYNVSLAFAGTMISHKLSRITN